MSPQKRTLLATSHRGLFLKSVDWLMVLLVLFVLAEVFGQFDYAILGIGAYEPAWFMRANHQSPEDALRTFTKLNAIHFISMHYGTFDLSNKPLSLKKIGRRSQAKKPYQQLRHIGNRQTVTD